MRVSANAQPQAVFSPGNWNAKPISPAWLLGSWDASFGQHPDGPWSLVLIDLTKAVVHPLRSLGAPQMLGPSPFLTDAIPGAFAMVDTGGDCLNVREAASADSKSLGCFADGVLLTASDVISVVEGEEWQSVTTPSGQSGWASAAFLVR
jgi:hypothetical protein